MLEHDLGVGSQQWVANGKLPVSTFSSGRSGLVLLVMNANTSMWASEADNVGSLPSSLNIEQGVLAHTSIARSSFVVLREDSEVLFVVGHTSQADMVPFNVLDNESGPLSKSSGTTNASSLRLKIQR